MPPQLPVITFDVEALNPSNPAWLSTSHVVRRALEEYGCFVLSTKKIPWDLRETMFELSKDLFLLPIETKTKNCSKILGFGYGNYSSLPLFESFGIEDGATLEATRSFTHLLFPSGNDAFCKTAFEYMTLLSEIIHCVMRMVFDSYGIEDKQFEGSLFYLAKFMKYRAPVQGEGPIALPPHSYKSFLGVLDDNGVKGFEVKTRNGEWINHEPSHCTFVVVAGEPLMLISHLL
ncbi:putative non-heme dioxygenase domain, isopenicillin N synthase [Helianthus annuus]|nr:putative non-heme dioxygenase domain, isopenicillin N synthase [Helianthus annuus]